MQRSVPPSAAPTLETERLILRAFSVADLDQIHANWSDPDVYKFTVGRPPTREESWNRLMRYFGHWAALGMGFWAVIEKQSGKLIGDVGLADFHRGIEPLPEGIPEMGWVLAATAHGKGYATEALTVILQWADQHLAASEAYCIIHTKNQDSMKLARKFGFQKVAQANYHDLPHAVLKRVKK